jgi:hypothetical protein
VLGATFTNPGEDDEIFRDRRLAVRRRLPALRTAPGDCLRGPGDSDGGYGGRGFPAVALVESGKVLFAGGLPTELVEEGPAFVIQGQGQVRRSTLVFDPLTLEFERVGDLNLRRFFPLAAPAIQSTGALVTAVRLLMIRTVVAPSHTA